MNPLTQLDESQLQYRLSALMCESFALLHLTLAAMILQSEATCLRFLAMNSGGF